jgi:hypothetical protein
MKKLVLFVFLFCFFCIGFHLIYLYNHREFRPDDFRYHLSSTLPMEVPVLNQKDEEEVRHILSQKFHYLAFGKQMTAYESQDHQYVLKFFNPRAPIEKSWFFNPLYIKRLCTLKWISDAYFKRGARLTRLFERYVLAYKNLKEETGLVFVHLYAGTNPCHVIEVVGKDGKNYLVDPSHTPFILQKKTELAGHYLHKLREMGNQEELDKALQELRTLFVSRAKKGFTDRIQTLYNNYGFLNGKAVQIDFGRICYDPSIAKNVDAELERISLYLKRSFPDLIPQDYTFTVECSAGHPNF